MLRPYAHGDTTMKILFRQSGFSLIELLIALGILAGASAMLLGGMGTAMMMQNRDEAMLKGVMLANNKMAEVEAEVNADIEKNKFPEEDSQADKFDSPHDGYEWSYTIRKVEIPFQAGSIDNQVMRTIIKQIVKDISKAVRELKVTVTWIDAEDEKPREVVLTTHLMNLK